MVKDQVGSFSKVEPTGRIDLDAIKLVRIHIDKRKIRYGNGTLSRITVNLAVGAQLLHVDVAQPCQGVQHPDSGLIKVFVLLQKSPDQGPFSLFWLKIPFDGQY